MSGKWDVRDIAAANFGTYVDADGRRRVSDIVVFFGLPLAFGAACGTLRYFDHLHILDPSKLVGGIGIFTGLLFGLLTNVFTLSLRVRRDEGLHPDHDIIRDVRDLFSNLSWAVLVGLLLVVLLVIVSATHDAKKSIGVGWTVVLVAIFSHLVLTILMSLKRLWFAHQNVSNLPPKVAQ
ncbi:hypothetical protein [Streptomyces griseoaurantiacus]|uniref:Uncharacterized protein n=1 Tax=Streptomyces griseoaurantiacus TaxID=68213 RepID=A0A7W2DR94_9ACTN|nr:hypothetical protein [Streptomyces griseoaurantiacus]MBA5221502.1 hypothetical protein [Streptomyces griseoaurantiacus]